MTVPATLTVQAAAGMLRRRELSSVELVTAALARADALDDRLGAYVSRFDEPALAAAKQADADFAAGVDRGPLQGIPMAVKDNLFAEEGPTTAQTRVLDPSWESTADATVVARLRAAGAVLTGKLTLSEFAIGAPDLDSPYPRPRNPWHLGCWPGGSSSGTGVAVAAGLVLAGLGTDTAGSIRIPSAVCGLSGLKPTFGRVPTTGSVALAVSMDHVGPMARSVWDCAALLGAIAGADPADVTSLRAPVPDYLVELLAPLEPVRVGVVPGAAAGVPIDDGVETAFAEALGVLRSLGLTTTNVTLPDYDATVAASKVILSVESFALHEATLRVRWNDYSRSTRQRLATGAFASGAEFLRAQEQRRATKRKLASLFDGVDVVVSPTMTLPAPRFGPDEALDRAAITSSASTVRYWSVAGYPALVIPVGRSATGMPLSLQLAAKPLHESLLFRVGAAVQRITDWHLGEPALTTCATPTDRAAPPAAPRDEDVAAAAAMLARTGIEPGADRHAMGAAYAAHQADVATLLSGSGRRPFAMTSVGA